MNIRETAVSRLKEYENNPRNNDLAVEKVKYSIERFGFLVPVIVDVNYVIVAGHTRVRACRELGIQSVPCVIADELTEEQINFFRLVDNKTSEYSDWDFEKLKEELELIDLTLEKNQLLLEQFELSTEVFDIEPEQAEIRIPSFNFTKNGDARRDKKPTVNTIKSPENEADEADDDADADEVPFEQDEPAARPAAAVSGGTNVDVQGGASDATRSDSAEAPKAKQPTLIQFRFGDVAFFISQIELDRLNSLYSEFINSDEVLKMSFANFLLKGVESGD